MTPVESLLDEDDFAVMREEERLLGFCNACFRMRWLSTVDRWVGDGCRRPKTPYGTCSGCVREESLPEGAIQKVICPDCRGEQVRDEGGVCKTCDGDGIVDPEKL